MLAVVEALDPMKEALDVHLGAAAARCAMAAALMGKAKHE
jgi:hypothetical protein